MILLVTRRYFSVRELIHCGSTVSVAVNLGVNIASRTTKNPFINLTTVTMITNV